MSAKLNDIDQRWQALQVAEPGLRIRSAAQRLGVSEMTLLLLRRQRHATAVIALRPEFAAIYAGLAALGEIMSLTRNDAMVHETIGTFGEPRGRGAMGLFLGAIDLRIFFKRYAFGFVVQEHSTSVRTSLQFFDVTGQALHKIYQTDQTDQAAWSALVARFSAADTSGIPLLQPWPANVPGATTAPADTAAFQADWLQLQDVHHFRALLQRHQTDRVSAYPCVADHLACPLAPEAFEAALGQIAAGELSVMVFVGNSGLIQIYTGPLHQLRRTGAWYNILDPKFNLHANIPLVSQCWRVRKPTRDGWVSSLELFAADGTQLLQLFGERHEGEPEQVRWQQLLQQLETAYAINTSREAVS